MNCVTAVLFIFAQVWLAQTEQISLKLVQGSNSYEGNVLVKRGSDWGLVCDDEWSMENGHVVCRQLGFGKATKITTYNKFDSSRMEPIFLDDVKCQGHETNLGQCKHREWLQSNCNAGEAAGVICEGRGTSQSDTTEGRENLLSIIANTGTGFTLPATTNSPELTSQSSGSDSSDLDQQQSRFSERTRSILERARALLRGYSPDMVASPQQAGQDSFGHLFSSDDQAALPYTRDADFDDGPQLGLTALEEHQGSIDRTLSQAAAALQGISGSYELGSDDVKIREPSQAEIQKIDDEINELVLKSDQPQAPPPKPYRVEVVGGVRSNEGYVRVTLDNGKRGAICSDNWGIYEAMVVCRQTGKQQAEKATLIDYFGASSEDKVIYELNCDGHERSLADCEYRLADRHGVKCSKPMNVAGVVCTSAKLPDLMPNIWALQTSMRIEQKPLFSLTCAMEENCLSSSAYTAQASHTPTFGGFGGSSFGLYGGFNSGPTRKLLRFSSNIFNNGTADFRPRQHRTQWEWHSCHQHYHSMGAFSHYDILDSHGNRVAEGHKASFCLEDVECQFPHRKKYSCRGFADQGISVGCADVYQSDIDCQWVDITDLKPGAYVFKLNVNPGLEVPELSFDNNAAICEMSYNGYSAKLSNCVLARG